MITARVKLYSCVPLFKLAAVLKLWHFKSQVLHNISSDLSWNLAWLFFLFDCLFVEKHLYICSKSSRLCYFHMYSRKNKCFQLWLNLAFGYSLDAVWKKSFIFCLIIASINLYPIIDKFCWSGPNFVVWVEWEI